MQKIICKISPYAKLPLKLNHGNEGKRFEKAEILTKKVFDYMETNHPNNWTDKNLEYAILRTINSYPPLNLEFATKENKDGILGSIERIVSAAEYKNTIDYIGRNFGKKVPVQTDKPFVFASVDGYRIHTDMDKSGKIKNKYATIHEVRHLFDYIFNPKLTVLRFKDCAFYPNEYFEIYQNVQKIFLKDLNNTSKIKNIKTRARKYLNKLPNEMRINLIQDIRGSLKTENNAHNQELAFYLQKPLQNFEQIFNHFAFLKLNCKFNQKLTLANEFLKEFIKIERESTGLHTV